MSRLNLKGQGSIYVLLILGGIIAVSFLISDGILPKIKHSDKSDRVVSKVFLPKAGNSENSNGLQLKNIEYDPASITIIPTPTILAQAPPNNTDPTPTLAGGEQLPTQALPTATSTVAPTRATQPITPTRTAQVNPTATGSPGQTVAPTSTPIRTPTPTGLPPLNSFQQRLLAIARSQKGDPYGWGDCHNWYQSSLRPGNPPVKSNGCPTYDCSGFLGWVYYWATNGSFNMRGQTCRDFGNCYNYENVYLPENPGLYTKFYTKDLNKIQFGDIVYFGNIKSGKYYPTHVGLYIGEYGNCGAKDCIIDSSSSGKGVSERSLAKVPKGVIGFLRPKL